MPVGTHYGDTSVKEDVLDIIAQITPEDTPFYDMIGDGGAASPKHEWQTRDLSTRNGNAQIEGDTYTFAAPVLPTRVNNFTQIVRKDVRLSGTSQATSRHAIGDLAADQTEQRMVEWKTDVEHALLRGSSASGNASNTARQMDGLLNVISTNATAFASGTTLGETELNDLLNNVWNSGGKPRDALVNGFLKRRISAFTGGSTKNFEQTEKKIINTVSVYESDFSVVAMHLSRDMLSGTNANALAVVDKDMFAKAWLRRPFTERAPKVADSIDIVILGELTLEYGNEAAAGLITAAS
jgi:hypothetical protein